MTKDASLCTLTDVLIRRFGADSIVVIDHWEDDDRAIGIASSRDPARLVYVAALEDAPGAYDLALEDAPEEEDLPYSDCGWHYRVRLPQLIRIVANHLRLQN